MKAENGKRKPETIDEIIDRQEQEIDALCWSLEKADQVHKELRERIDELAQEITARESKLAEMVRYARYRARTNAIEWISGRLVVMRRRRFARPDEIDWIADQLVIMRIRADEIFTEHCSDDELDEPPPLHRPRFSHEPD